jgi:hypothetical protein
MLNPTSGLKSSRISSLKVMDRNFWCYEMSNESNHCRQTCKYYTCAQGSLHFQDTVPWCKYADDECEIEMCKYAQCLRNQLLPKGICGMESKRPRLPETLPEETPPPIEPPPKLAHKLKERELYWKIRLQMNILFEFSKILFFVYLKSGRTPFSRSFDVASLLKSQVRAPRCSRHHLDWCFSLMSQIEIVLWDTIRKMICGYVNAQFPLWSNNVLQVNSFGEGLYFPVLVLPVSRDWFKRFES